MTEESAFLNAIAAVQTWDTQEIEDAYLSFCISAIETYGMTRDWIYEVISLVDETYFSDPSRAAIYKAIREVTTRTATGSIVMPGFIAKLAEGILGMSGQLLPPGWAIDLIAALPPTIMFAPDIFANTIVPMWRIKNARPIIRNAAELIVDALNEDPSEKLFTEVLPTLIERQSDTWQKVIAPPNNEEEAWESTISEALKPLPEDDAVSTGIKVLDKTIQGGIAGKNSAYAGRLIVIAARPGMGKTTAAVTLATHLAKNNTDVAFFSLEMPAKQIQYKSITALDYLTVKQNGTVYNPIRSTNLQNRSYTEDQRKRMEAIKTSGFIKRFNVFAGSQSISSLSSRIKILAKTRPNLRGIFIDYLQLIDGCAGNKNMTEASAIGQVTQALKKLAVDIRIDIFLLCQVNRSVEQRNDKMPSLADLRASGRIEEDADIVAFLLRPAYYDSNRDEYELAISIAKNRLGHVGTLKCCIDMKSSVIFDSQV